MTPEEKAKAYDKALERAKKWYNEEEPDSYTCIVESIFPELQKDEDEEPQENKNKRIRKALISILKSDFEKDTTIFDISVGEIIAWLEKQGEQNYEFHGIAESRPAKGKLKELCQELSQSEVTKISEQGWSEECDENLMMIEDRFSDYLDYIREDSSITKHRKNTLKEEIIGYVNWLESLKERLSL